MSKQEIAESLEEINKKLNVLVKKKCNKFADSDKEEVEDGGSPTVEEKVKGKSGKIMPKHSRSAFIFFCQEERPKLKKRTQK